MAAPPMTTHYADVTHNLGYKPIVIAYTYFGEYGLEGWRMLPAMYWYAIEPGVYDVSTVFFEHINDNTVRFYGTEGREIIVQLFLEPRKDAWYE
jgi:hypothetical protein